MRSESAIHHRQSIRMKGYDYSQTGSYYITICTCARHLFFGDVAVEGNPDKGKGVPYEVNERGRIVETEWLSLQSRFSEIALDRYSVMPDHFHGIIKINRQATAEPAPTIADMICAFKSITTKACNAMDATQGRKIWQRDYFERVIRNPQELVSYQKYIMDNPSNWKKGEHYLFSTETVGAKL